MSVYINSSSFLPIGIKFEFLNSNPVNWEPRFLESLDISTDDIRMLFTLIDADNSNSATFGAVLLSSLELRGWRFPRLGEQAQELVQDLRIQKHWGFAHALKLRQLGEALAAPQCRGVGSTPTERGGRPWLRGMI